MTPSLSPLRRLAAHRCILAGLATAAVAAMSTNAKAVVISFAGLDGGWSPATESGSTSNPFTWGGTSGVGGVGAWAVDGLESTVQTLTSPAFVVSADGPLSLTVEHRYNFLYFAINDDALDGGHVRYSVNGGGWQNVGSESFDNGGYTPDVDGVDALGGDNVPGWSNTSPGNADPAYITSHASFGSFTSGDTVQVQFRAGWTGFGPFENPNWVIGSVALDNAQAVPEPAHYALAAGGLLAALGFGRWATRSRRPESRA